MTAVDVTISGVLFDKHNRTTQQVVLIGEATLTGLGVGGGPIFPPPGGGERPPGIWGGPIDPYPDHGLPSRPGIWPGPGDPDYPIKPLPPDAPHVPPPGSPPVIVPGTHPAHPITPPPAVIIDYPGIGKVVVPQPVTAAPSPQK